MSSPEAMGGMDHAPMKGGGDSPYGEDAGDVTYPHYLVNGKVPEAPDVLAAKPGTGCGCGSSMPPPTPSLPSLSAGTAWR